MNFQEYFFSHLIQKLCTHYSISTKYNIHGSLILSISIRSSHQGHRNVWKSGGGAILVWWTWSAPLVETRLSDLPKSGGGGGARQTLLPPFGSDSPAHTRRAYNLPQKPIIIPLQWRWWVLGSRTCIHYKVTFGNQSCKEKGTLPLFETRIRTNLSTQCCILCRFWYQINL